MTFSSALPILLRIARKGTVLKHVLGCAGQPALHDLPKTVRETPDLDWSHCPLDLLDTPYLVAVQHLSRLAEVSPLSGWPTAYAAWAVSGVLTLREV